MQRLTKGRVAVVGTLAVALAAGSALTVYAASAPSYPTTSDARIYLLDAAQNSVWPAEKVMAWDEPMSVVASAVSTIDPAHPEAGRLPFVDGSQQYSSFIAAPGDERVPAKWKAWNSPAPLTNNKGALLPPANPGGSFDRGNVAEVKLTGGTYSLGVAYTRTSIVSATTAAFFTTIKVEPITGEWQFATPGVQTQTSTTLQVSRTTAPFGAAISLTATVSPAATGTVTFADGSRQLGSAPLANGKASISTSALSVGDHALRATYLGEGDVTGSTSAVVNLTVSAAAFTKVTTPTISGKAAVGSTLKAAVGAWSPAATLRYQWLLNGKAIAGKTSSSLVLAASHLNGQVSVRVVGSKANYASQTRTSKAVKVGKGSFTARPVPKVVGTAKVGRKLSVALGKWAPAPTLSYQWLANGKAIKKATKSTFTPAKAQRGKKISVKVTAKRAGFTTVSTTSKATAKLR